MPFDYYHRLTLTEQRIYRESDRVNKLPLGDPATLRREVPCLQAALQDENRDAVQRSCKALTDEINARLSAPRARVKVLAARPSDDWGEMQGCYDLAEGKNTALITVWMRTARHKKVVAFRTFLRTLLHEICHHLDYYHLGLADSFHTEGFFKRESSLFYQLVPREEEQDSGD